MTDDYCLKRMNTALEERLQLVSKENTELKQKVEKMLGDYDAMELRKRIERLDDYDRTVQQIIGASSILSEAWDNFRVQYQLTASEALLETAREKIAGRAEGVCHGCKREF